jgi:hypothetical protein
MNIMQRVFQGSSLQSDSCFNPTVALNALSAKERTAQLGQLK